MSWRAMDEDDLLTQISGPELEAIRAAALGTGQADPVQPTIDQVTSEVRGYIAACAKNTLGTEGTLPEELIGHAAALAVMRIMPRAAGLVIGEARKTAAETARTVLRDVAACRFLIVQPETATTENVTSGGVEIASTPVRKATRDQMAGL